MTEREAEEAVAAHYGMLLGIQSPWKVKRAKLEIAQRLLEIEVEHEPGKAGALPAMPARVSASRSWAGAHVAALGRDAIHHADPSQPAALRLRGVQGDHAGAAVGRAGGALYADV